MGLIVSVYRGAGHGDYSNGGLSSQFDDLCVVNIPAPFDPTDDRPAFALVPGNLPGTAMLVPVDDPRSDIGPRTFGGNYAACSDSRFCRKVEEITGSRFYGAVPIHDRYDTWENFERLTT